MAKILILYSTTDGHTRKICRYIQPVLENQGNEVDIFSIDDEAQLALDQYDKILVGASIRYGKHNKKVYDFIDRNETILQDKPSAFFSVNVVARKPDKNQPDTNPYVRKFLQQIPWQPDAVAVFAGKIDYQKYRFLDRLMIRLIMYMTHGPTDPNTVAEFTDWDQVKDFGRIVSTM